MRVIAGTARSRRLEALPGLDTRPTTDRVKESIFNVIQFDIEGRRVLDLFAGTGQLGVEALSRGAAFCDFVDSAPAALEVARKNVKACGFEGRAATAGIFPPFSAGPGRNTASSSWTHPTPREAWSGRWI